MGRRILALVVVAAVVLVLVVVDDVVQGRWEDIPWWTLLWMAGLFCVGNGPRRAIRRNTD